MNKTILVFLSLAALSCQKLYDSAVKSTEYCKVKLELECQETVQKSVFGADENYIESLAVWVYDSTTGKLLKSSVFSDSSIQSGNMELYVPKNKNSTFLFLANMRAMDAPALLSDALNLRYVLDEDTLLNRLFPMSQSIAGRPVMEGMTLRISLVRMVAEYVFRLDTSGLKGKFTLKSINVRQSAMDVGIFSQTAATEVSDGDAASQSDLDLVSRGGPAKFYMLENCRGMLTPWNTDPWKKIPVDDSEALLATYIEVHARYVSPTMQSSDLTYRMYLGNNETKNYDITRNTVHVVTLMPSDTGLSKSISDTQWKIDPGNYEITGSLAFSRNVAACAAWYNPPYIIRKNGSRVQTISDSLSIVRSSSKLSYTTAYDNASSNIDVSGSNGVVKFKPAEDKYPSGSFNVNLTSYDGLLSDNATVYGGVMDLVFRFDHSTGIIQVWSSDKNPRNIKLHLKMDYEVYSSVWSGSSWSKMTEYKDSFSGRFETDFIPSSTVQNIDGGALCSAIRNQSDGIMPTPSGFARYTPYLIKVYFDYSVVSPEIWKGRTIIRQQCGLFNQSSVGFVNNQYYMGFWYVEDRLDGYLTFYRKETDGVSTSLVSFEESCHGIQYRKDPEDYRIIVFEI